MIVNYPHVRITNINNTKGIDLNDFDGYLMTSPTGFGIYRTSEYITVGNQRISADNRPTFQKINFNIDIFGKRAEMEQKYAILRDFISQNIKKGFRLYYQAHDQMRYIKCDINIVDKTQKMSAYLPVKLEIQPKSLWLVDENKINTSQGRQTGNIFKFKLRTINEASYDSAVFDFYSGVLDEYGDPYYSMEFFTGATAQAILHNTGSETTPLIIRIYGECINPFVRLFKYGSSIASQTIVFENLEIPDGYYLEINSSPDTNYIELVNERTGQRYDRESFASIDSNMYISLPQGDWVIDVSDETGLNKCYSDIFFSNQYYGG